jgi:hypothetical protein
VALRRCSMTSMIGAGKTLHKSVISALTGNSPMFRSG